MPYVVKKLKKWPKGLERPISRLPDKIVKLIHPNMTGDQWVEQERYAKLKLLLQHYKIEGETRVAWIELAKQLAIERFVGMRLPDGAKAVGKRKHWTGAHGAQFVAEVQAIKEAMKCNTSQAINELCELDPERYPLAQKRSLRKRYDEARKRIRNP
jgi:hypothetical protein